MWLYFSLSFITATLITPLIISLYRHFGWDKSHHNRIQKFKDTHQKNVPRGGGLVIFFSLILVLALVHNWSPEIQAIIIGVSLLTLVGFLDDLFDLSPFLRLLVNLAVAVIIIKSGIQINFVTNPFGEGVIEFNHWWLTGGLTLFYLIFLTNITNWAKGIDGQMPGMVVLAAIFIGFLSLRLTNQEINQTTMMSFITAGSFAGFLVWNFYPQKIMPGYGGGSMAGFLLAVLSILSGTKLATLFMVLALPIADAVFTILRRVLAGKSPFWGDRGHLHHKLLDQFGWGRRRIAIFYWLVTLVMGFLALILPTWGKIIAFVIVVGLTFVFLIGAKILSLQKSK